MAVSRDWRAPSLSPDAEAKNVRPLLRARARQLVQDNQVMVGSVTAARDHFQLAVDDLTQAQARWGEHLGRLITGRYPAADFAAALAPQRKDRIKVVLEWE